MSDDAHMIRTPKGVFRIFTGEELETAAPKFSLLCRLAPGNVRVMNVNTGKCFDAENREAALKAIGDVPPEGQS